MPIWLRILCMAVEFILFLLYSIVRCGKLYMNYKESKRIYDNKVIQNNWIDEILDYLHVEIKKDHFSLLITGSILYTLAFILVFFFSFRQYIFASYNKLILFSVIFATCSIVGHYFVILARVLLLVVIYLELLCFI